MLTNNIKIAFRNLWKNKVYTIINILGLMIGITVALLLYRMVSYELSFNKSFAEYDRIVRVVSEERDRDGEVQMGVCMPIPAMTEMQASVPQFVSSSKTHETRSMLTIADPNGETPLKKFQVEDRQTALFVEDGFFDVFNLDWKTGGAQPNFTAPGMIVLREDWAKKCFGSVENAIGKIMMAKNLIPVKVTGVFAALPDNVDFNFPYLLSYPTLENNAGLYDYEEEWGSCGSDNQFYALLENPTQTTAANAILANIGKEQYSNGANVQERVHQLQPLSDLHYNEELQHFGTHRTSKKQLQILSFIGLLILLIGCFNFINLSTAQAALRAQEVGVRKVLGSNSRQLVVQFMTETGLIVVCSVLLGMLMAKVVLPFFNEISDVPATLPFLSDPMILTFLGVTTLAITFLAGLYPALIVARFQPKRALSRHLAKNDASGGHFIRKTIVVSQFVIAQVLVIGALLTVMQLNYIQDQDLGFDDELVYNFYFNSDSLTVARQGALRQAIQNIPTVQNVSFSTDPPISRSTWASNFRYSSRPEDEPYAITMKFVDANYQETYGIELVAGRWLSPSDTMRQVVVNMTTVKKLGFKNPEEVIGQSIGMGGRKLPIVGVTNEFHTHSLHSEHLPLLLSTRKEYYEVAGVKVRPDNIASTLTAIRTAYDKVLPEQIMDGDFMDEDVASFYESEQRLAVIYQSFGLLAILISCLGLFGLLTHAAHQRVKEIGIRKVLGASVLNIIALLSKDFIQLVVIAFLIATPIAYYFMNEWLQDFAYRIDMQWWMFALGGVVAIGIALLTVSFQSVKAALANPVNSLRSE